MLAGLAGSHGYEHVRGPLHRGRAGLLLGVFAGAAFAPGFAAAATHEDGCHVRVIVAFASPQGAPPDAHFVTNLAHATAVQLTFLRSIGPGLDLFALSSSERDPSCRNALARLRHDRRVRSADVDQRRRVQG